MWRFQRDIRVIDLGYTIDDDLDRSGTESERMTVPKNDILCRTIQCIPNMIWVQGIRTSVMSYTSILRSIYTWKLEPEAYLFWYTQFYDPIPILVRVSRWRPVAPRWLLNHNNVLVELHASSIVAWFLGSHSSSYVHMHELFGMHGTVGTSCTPSWQLWYRCLPIYEGHIRNVCRPLFYTFFGGESLLSELRNKAMTEQSTVPSKRGKHGNSWRLPICTFQDIRYQIRFGSMVKCRDGKFEFIGELYISREMKFCHRKQNADKVFLTRTKSSISTAS